MSIPKSIRPSSSTATSTTLAPPPNHTAASLVERHGASDRATIQGYVWGLSPNDLFARGRRVTSPTLVKAGVAMLGEASDFILVATPAQKILLASIDGRFLSAAASLLREVEVVHGQLSRRQSARKSRRGAKQTAQDKLMTEGRARRELYRANLVACSGDDAGWKGRIEDACSSVQTPAELADSFEALAQEGAALVRHLRSEGRPCALDDAYLTAITADARTLRDGTADSQGVESKLGLQRGDLDWWEGAGVWFLKTLRDVFTKAHGVDPSVPRLNPGALRNVIAPNTLRKHKDEGTDEETDEPAPEEPPTP